MTGKAAAYDKVITVRQREELEAAQNRTILTAGLAGSLDLSKATVGIVKCDKSLSQTLRKFLLLLPVRDKGPREKKGTLRKINDDKGKFQVGSERSEDGGKGRK